MKTKAVDFLEFRYIYNINLMDYDFKQAKEMEKQQIIDAYASGYIDGVARNKITAEQYYNETFNKNKR
jgi:hypothetical protein